MADITKLNYRSRLKTSNLQYKNLCKYLSTHSKAVLEKFYNHPIICLTVFRELSKMACQYVLMLLFVEQPISQKAVASWCQQAFAAEHLKTCKILSDLCVWLEAPLPDGLLGWILHPIFQRNLKIALYGGGKSWSMSPCLVPEDKARDIDFLDAYSIERWECILQYMVGSQKQVRISLDSVGVLLHAGLMKKSDDNDSHLITPQGFQFVLLERPAQVWYFMLQYLDTAEERGLDLTECHNFLFQLSFSTPGKDYSTEGMSAGLLIFLQHLREIGLIYQKQRKTGRFYPTRLALNITNSRQNGKSILKENVDKGYIIVETNFMVYAYSNSELQISLLGLFTHIFSRLPNLVVGKLTRNSIRQAVRNGITAKQIITFLKQHSHSQMFQVDSGASLPPSVMDFIILWEMEKMD